MTGTLQALGSAVGMASDGWKPYPTYKDSGVEWLSLVPEHWDCLPHRAIFQEVLERNRPDEPMLSVTIGRGVIRQEDLLADSSKKDSSNTDKTKYKLVSPGDIAYNKMRAWQGAIGVSQYSGIISPAYIVVKPRKRQNTRYFHYLFRTPAFATEAERWSYGITSDQWSLRSEDFKRIYSVIPPPSDQAAIVRFLDHYDRLIGKYIRAKQKMIALLTEQKQAIIQHAVTRGLNPNVKLKPSGVDWLGDIPEHWSLRRLKYLVRNVNNQVSEKEPDEIYVPMESVKSWSGTITPQDSDVLFDSSVKRFLPDDLLFGKLRPYLAKVARPQTKGVCVGEFLVLRVTDSEVVPGFLENVLRSKSFIDLVNSSTFGAKMPRAEWVFIGSVPIAFPQGHFEQERILAEIRARTDAYQDAIDVAERQIALMREYRTRLTADVVTGKIDVREAAAALPSFEDESPIADTDLEEPTDEEEALDVAE